MFATLLFSSAGCSPKLHRLTLTTHYDVDRKELSGVDVAVQVDFDAKGSD